MAALRNYISPRGQIDILPPLSFAGREMDFSQPVTGFPIKLQRDIANTSVINNYEGERT